MEYHYELSLKTESAKQAKTFWSLLNKEFEDSFDDSEIESDFPMSAEKVELPLYDVYVESYYEMILEVVTSTAKHNPEDDFLVDFTCVNCSGEFDNVHAVFEYSKEKLSVDYINVESSVLFCECDEDYENDLATSSEHSYGKTYICPVCGKVVCFNESEDSKSFEVDIYKDSLSLKTTTQEDD